MESDVVVRRVSDGLQQTLRRLSSLAGGVAMVAAVVGLATFATGLWIFKGTGRPTWIVIGGVLCLIPVGAALCARMLIRVTARHSPELVANVRSFLNSSSQSAKVLIDHDTGQPVAAYAKNFTVLRAELNERRKELPALFAGIRAITSVPGLAALAVLGTVCIGALGTILLIGGLID
jgi:NAD/NADP transhydrogenase alpha subunit